MLGTAALIITLSILDGFEHEIKEKVVGFTSHIVVQGFENAPLTGYVQSIERVMKDVPEVRAISPFAAKEGMIRSRESVDGIFVKGIDVASDVLTPRQHLVKGKFLSTEHPDGPAQLVIGNKLAMRLNVDVGDKVVVFALPSGGGGQTRQPRAMQFVISGLYESGMAEYDDVYGFTDLGDAQRLFQMGETSVTGYDVLVNDINTVDGTARTVQIVLGYPHYARTVFDLYRNLFSWVELQKQLSPLLLSLIIIVATVNIIGTLLMFVLEKTAAIGVLKSLGAGPRLIRNIFVLQGLAIAGSGIILGNILAYGLCWMQLKFKLLSLPADIYYMNTVPIMLKPENFLVVTLVTIILCFLTSLIPSRAAAKLDPLIAFRFG